MNVLRRGLTVLCVAILLNGCGIWDHSKNQYANEVEGNWTLEGSNQQLTLIRHNNSLDMWLEDGKSCALGVLGKSDTEQGVFETAFIFTDSAGRFVTPNRPVNIVFRKAESTDQPAWTAILIEANGMSRHLSFKGPLLEEQRQAFQALRQLQSTKPWEMNTTEQAMQSRSPAMMQQHFSDGMLLAARAKAGVSEYFATNGRWPSNNTEANVSDVSSDVVRSVQVGNEGVITIRYVEKLVPGPEGKTVILTPREQSGAVIWDCTGGTFPNEFRDIKCQK